MWSKPINRTVATTLLIFLATAVNLLTNAQQYSDEFQFARDEILLASSLGREQFVQYNQLKEETNQNQRNQMPNNFSVEAVSSSSIRLRWQPPSAKEFAVLQYKIKYEKVNSDKQPDTITFDAKVRSHLIENLESDADYRVKISAIFVNDNVGPFTKWRQVRTPRELDESHVPDKPEYLAANGKSTRIHLRWSPPLNRSVKIREYLLNFGVNFPDINHLTIDASQNEYTIKDLQPKQEYVISLRANNKFGAGPAVYATAKTTTKDDDDLVADELDEEEDELEKAQELDKDPDKEADKDADTNADETNKSNLVPKLSAAADNVLSSLHTHDPELLPPLGVKAEVLGASKVRVSWIDQAKKDQSYMIKFNSLVDRTSKGKVRLLNTSDDHILIDDLKPFTKYEFAVKMMRRNRASTWSMSVLNVTSEALPSGAPRDLVVMPVSNLIGDLSKFAGATDPLLTNKITPNDAQPNAENGEPDNRLTELAYAGSGSSLSKQATMKRTKSAISRTGKYRNRKPQGRQQLSFDGGDAEDDELGSKSPSSQNYVQEPETGKQKSEDLGLEKPNDINNLFDKQAVPGLAAVSLR